MYIVVAAPRAPRPRAAAWRGDSESRPRPPALRTSRAARHLAQGFSPPSPLQRSLAMPATYGPCHVRLVWGNANFGGAMPTGGDAMPAGYEKALAALAAAGVTEIDTSRAYRQGKAEEWHGEALRSLPAATSAALTISTKAHPMFSLRYDALRRQAAESMALLGVDKLDIFYLHGVDPTTPIEDTLRAVHELHQEGVFSRFGLSNYPAWQVVQIHSLCQRRGYVVPSVSVPASCSSRAHQPS